MTLLQLLGGTTHSAEEPQEMYCIFQLAYLLTFSAHPFFFLDSHQLLPGHRVLDSRESPVLISECVSQDGLGDTR